MGLERKPRNLWMKENSFWDVTVPLFRTKPQRVMYSFSIERISLSDYWWGNQYGEIQQRLVREENKGSTRTNRCARLVSTSHWQSARRKCNMDSLFLSRSETGSYGTKFGKCFSMFSNDIVEDHECPELGKALDFLKTLRSMCNTQKSGHNLKLIADDISNTI